MFSASKATKELHICLRCEYRLLRASASRLPSFRRHARRFITNPSQSYPSQSSEYVKATSSSTKSNQGHGAQENFRKIKPLSHRPEDRSGNSLLRLSTLGINADAETDGGGPFKTLSLNDIHKEHLPISTQKIPDAFSPAYGLEVQKEAYEEGGQEFKYPAFRHPDVASDRVELGVQRLGEPATIRVLPERRSENRRRRSKHVASTGGQSAEIEGEQQTQTSYDDIAKTLDLEDEGTAGAAESMNNIENIRKAFLESINQFEGATLSECLKVANSLEQGFTVRQLRRYKAFAITMKSPEPDTLESLSIKERYSVSRWYAGPSKWPNQSFTRLNSNKVAHEKDLYAFPSSGLDSNGIPKQNPKQMLIHSIINACWGIRPREERLLEGSVSMRIGKEWLDLLLRQGMSGEDVKLLTDCIADEQVFHKVSENFKVKSEIYEPSGLIRITGRYDACVDAVRTVSTVISDAQSQRISLLHPSYIDLSRSHKTFLHDVIKIPQFWREIENHTMTRIQPVNPKINGYHTEIDVFYLSTGAKGLSGVVRRVRQLHKLIDSDSTVLCSFPKFRDMIPSLKPVANPPDMPLVERFLQWYRWIDRKSTQKDSMETSSILGEGIHEFDRLASFWTSNFVKDVQRIHQVPADDACWNFTPQTSMSAILGHLVYAVPEHEITMMQKQLDGQEENETKPDGAIQTRKAFPKDLSQYQRTIIPSIPNLISLLSRQVENESTLANFFRITLTPKTIQGNNSKECDRAPLLEMEIDIDEFNKSTKLRYVRLILDQQCVDLALRRQASDIRFTTETFVTASSEHFDPAIVRFVKASNLAIWGTGQFETPSTLILKIPRRICQLVDKERPLSDTRFNLTKSSAPEMQRSTNDNKDGGRPAQDLHHAYSGEAHSAGDQNSTTSAAINPRNADHIIGNTTHPEKVAEIIHHKGEDMDMQVQYEFDSLTIHSKLQSLYQGFPLSLSTIEGGQVGGKRDEVRLDIPGIADDLINGKSSTNSGKKKSNQEYENRFEIAKTYFMASFRSISELIGRLSK